MKYNARVLYVSHEADLALLTVDDESFYSDVQPRSVGELPEIQKEVIIYGFPGSETLTITKGILSKIEHKNYKHSSISFLTGEIISSVKPGTSGGRVIADNKIVGVVMQAAAKDNLAQMVPTPVIIHFLNDINDGHFDGFPDLGLVVQKMENPDIKSKYGMFKEQTGILINHVLPDSPAEGRLMDNDILLAIDGHLIGDDGTVEFRPKERTFYTYLVDPYIVFKNTNGYQVVFNRKKAEENQGQILRTYSIVEDHSRDLIKFHAQSEAEWTAYH